MQLPETLSLLYSAMLIGTIGFQVALIFGAPWGRITQGGAHDGPLALKGRLLLACRLFCWC